MTPRGSARETRPTSVAAATRWAAPRGADAQIRRPVHPGDVVEIEAIVRRLRSRMGVLSGRARVNGKVVCHGTMTFALGERNEKSVPTSSQS